MIENNTYELTAFELDYQGQGICKLNDLLVFVPKLLKDEKAIVRIKKVKKNYCEGEIVSIIEPSIDRFSTLTYPNATLYHLNPKEELIWQERITKETIKKISDLDVKVNQTLAGSKETNYRNKVTLHVRFFNDRLNLGVFENKSHKLNQIDEDILALPVINEKIKQLNKLFSTVTLTDRSLEHIVLRTNGIEVLTIFVTSKKQWKEKEFFLENYESASIYQNIKEDSAKNLGNRNIFLKGKRTLDVKFEHLKFKLYPQAFFQINFEASILMYDYIKSNVDQNDVVIDAYAGVSSIGQYVSDVASKVISIESNHDAVISAKESIEVNHIKNLEILEQTVEDALKTDELKADVIVFDPPKAGLNQTIIDALIKNPVNKIIYASCDLKSLSRDLMYLKEVYEVESVQPVKMFYRTVENETVVVLKLK
ncbi:MAG: 23S rRNA (uracil(1939)-C(5))-methyltransferase RlmD [Paracholeplasma sp.]|nr:23S rRNA (uracil(1939)-C(5))-methyltransferase RlmD [Paracholeplasma sp.]MDY3195246.1 23S rRNA (uracil(1939)-C(5))-methyltransferase RlmD [Paracholeplasma sp.]